MSQIRENKVKLQSLLQDLATTVVPVLPEDWTKVVIAYFITGENKMEHQQIYFLRFQADDYEDLMEKAWDSEVYDDAVIELGIICKELHNICADAGDDWCSMTFTMTPDGAFNMDYSYENILNYNSKFILEWQSRYLD